MIGSTVTVIVDRPLGSCHPAYPTLRYPVNYGYIENVMAGDGEEQDVYVLGVDTPLEKLEGEVIAIIHRYDDVEDKWVVVPCGMRFTREQIEQAVHFQEQYFAHKIIT